MQDEAWRAQVRFENSHPTEKRTNTRATKSHVCLRFKQSVDTAADNLVLKPQGKKRLPKGSFECLIDVELPAAA